MKRFRPYYPLLRPVLPMFILALVCGLLAGAAGGGGLSFMQHQVFPVIFTNSETGLVAEAPNWLKRLASGFDSAAPSPHQITVTACLMLPLMFLIRGFFGYLNTQLINRVGLQVLEQIRCRAYRKLQYLPLSFHHRHKAGDLLTRLMDDTSQLQRVLTRISSDLVLQPATLIGAMCYLIYAAVRDESVFLILGALLSVPLTVLPIRLMGKRLARRAKAMQKAAGDMGALVAENLSSQREVRAYNMEESQISNFTNLTRKIFKLRLKVIKYQSLVSPSVELISTIGITFAIYMGAQRGMTLQNFVPLVTAMYFAYDPIKKLGAVHAQLKQAESSLDRLEIILNAEDTLPEPNQPKALGVARGEIEMRSLSFQYDDQIILNNLNLRIQAGESVALVGPSGAGKTTFVSLIPRFFEASGGQVLVDGVDVREVSKYELRNNIAIVSQQPLLFQGTVAENIRIGKPEATLEEIREASDRAHALDFIEGLNGGFDYVVGERGEGLSGGQKQRIAIARAFLKNAPILILDEATSALDAESEGRVQQSLDELSEGRTSFIIAHRFSSIRHAKRILVFEAGSIIADGTHEELMKYCELYKSLYESQMR